MLGERFIEYLELLYAAVKWIPSSLVLLTVSISLS